MDLFKASAEDIIVWESLVQRVDRLYFLLPVAVASGSSNVRSLFEKLH